jgi:hypothetical protein
MTMMLVGDLTMAHPCQRHGNLIQMLGLIDIAEDISEKPTSRLQLGGKAERRGGVCVCRPELGSMAMN